MKKVAFLALLAMGGIACSLAWADDREKTHEHGWFDAAHCTLCKPMSEHKELMMEMKWETHKIDNGLLMVASVPEEHMEVYRECCSQMDENIEVMKEGKAPEHLCGFCQSMGGLMQGGAKMEKVKTGFGTITLVTAGNEDAVGMIHKHAKRTQEEAKKMEEMMKNVTKAAAN
ncbi:MAG: hypothetical protein ACR2NU_15000 [Aeoliella sp.]